jgi:hypothetical protein
VLRSPLVAGDGGDDPVVLGCAAERDAAPPGTPERLTLAYESPVISKTSGPVRTRTKLVREGTYSSPACSKADWRRSRSALMKRARSARASIWRIEASAAAWTTRFTLNDLPRTLQGLQEIDQHLAQSVAQDHVRPRATEIRCGDNLAERIRVALGVAVRAQESLRGGGLCEPKESSFMVSLAYSPEPRSAASSQAILGGS